MKSLFLCPSNRWRSSDLENKIPRSSDVYMVPKKVSVVDYNGKKQRSILVSRYSETQGCCAKVRHISKERANWLACEPDNGSIFWYYFQDGCKNVKNGRLRVDNMSDMS